MVLRHVTWLYLWIAPHLLLIAIAAVMFRKGLHRQSPIFFCYLIFEIATSCLLFTLYSLKVAVGFYLNVDMFCRAGSIALRFGVFRELFESPLSSDSPLRRTLGRALNWVTAVLIALACAFIGSLYYAMHLHSGTQSYAILQALNAAQCGLLVLLFLWHRFLGLRMRSFAFGILLGMGLAFGVDPLLVAIKDFLVPQQTTIADLLDMGIYHIAVLVWLYYAIAGEKTVPVATPTPQPLADWASEVPRITQL